MPRIKCHYVDCVFVDDGFCSAAAVEIDPETGCNTYSPIEEIEDDEEWEDETEWEDDEEEEDDLWEDEDDL